MRNLIILLCLVLTGCYTERKATKQLIKAQAHYPTRVAELMSVWYPIKSFTKDTIIYKPGKNVEVPGPVRYVTVDCDSIVNLPKNDKSKNVNAKAVTVPCPPALCPSADTLEFYHHEVQESTAALQAEKGRVQALLDETTKLKEKNASQKKALSIAILGCVILGVYTLGRWILRIWNIKLP